ncbi:MAG: hypothetical protein ACRAVC_13190 [Trichormus sp.]
MLLTSAVAHSETVISQQKALPPEPKTIADLVLQDAIAKDKLDKTAKVIEIARISKGDTWIYNPVPYWKIAIADQHQRFVYFTTDDGKFTILMQRNGQNIHSQRQPAQEILPPQMQTAAIRKAKEWGYPGQSLLSNISFEKSSWASGCENISAPYACDPIPRKGWKITISDQGNRWVLRGESADDLQLIERSNSALENRLPSQVREEIKRIASQHLQLSPAVILMTKIQPQTFTDSCLGLGSLTESCAQKTIPGYRVTVVGKNPSERQIYRISHHAIHRRTEPIAGLPRRTDELPTAIARQVFNAAQADLQQTIENLSITEVEPIFACFRYPTDAPNTPCQPIQQIKAWKVTVTNYQKSRTYTINVNGTIASKR